MFSRVPSASHYHGALFHITVPGQDRTGQELLEHVILMHQRSHWKLWAMWVEAMMQVHPRSKMGVTQDGRRFTIPVGLPVPFKVRGGCCSSPRCSTIEPPMGFWQPHTQSKRRSWLGASSVVLLKCMPGGSHREAVPRGHWVAVDIYISQPPLV